MQIAALLEYLDHLYAHFVLVSQIEQLYLNL